jgi:hypothetical protein
MQTLGVSGTPVQSESRLKSLFWPSIQNADDVDYLGMQGYWVCAVVSVFTIIASALTGHPIAGVFGFLFYYFGGVGVREHSRWAASLVFAFYLVDTILSPGILKIILAGLLLANVRATWIASLWKADASEAAMPVRLSETWGDKFADTLPAWLWPKVRIPYFVFAAGFILLSLLGMAMLLLRRG